MLPMHALFVSLVGPLSYKVGSNLILYIQSSAFALHFQLLAWEPAHTNVVTMVTVRPNFQDSVHVGYISGLKKFTEYYTSVLCFTTPGDGPRSPAQCLRTHEDSKCCLFRLSCEVTCVVGLNYCFVVVFSKPLVLWDILVSLTSWTPH